MKSLMSVVELDNLRDKVRANLAELEKKTQVKVHLSTCGISSGAGKILDVFTREVEKLKLANVVVLQASCIGLWPLATRWRSRFTGRPLPSETSAGSNCWR